MSRWIENFENHPFQAKWAEILEASNALIIDDSSITTEVQELSRFKKAVTYVNELLQSIDPELTPEQTWANFDGQAQNCLQRLRNYQSDRNVGHIRNANTHVDNLLTYIRPYQVTASAQAKSAKRSYTEYSKTIKQHLSSFHDTANSLLEDIKVLRDSDAAETVSKLNELLDESQIVLHNSRDIEYEIESFRTRLLVDTDEADSVEKQVDELVTQLEESSRKINEFKAQLLEGDDDEPSIAYEIKEAKQAATDDSTEIEKLLSDTKNRLSQFHDYYSEVFGSADENGNREGGLKSELELRKKELIDFEAVQKKRYEELNSEINSLIPGATTAGLATAYKELKNQFSGPIKTYTWVFFGSIALIAAVALFTVDATSFSELSNNFINRLPIYIPLIWIAMFSSKRRNEAHRLQQEYAHKEAIAKSYQSFKMQINNLNDNDDAMMKQLLAAAIKAISRNSSETLDNARSDGSPAQETIESLKVAGKSTK
ncbi:hypothetical protein ACP7H9_02090 [Idiomarina sp. ST20R2A10]|uniref:hypothetical protein n=1 Tax=Idiomarina sp. ST20R2A10 TaxID=3418369 RepID=UPI003EC81A9C